MVSSVSPASSVCVRLACGIRLAYRAPHWVRSRRKIGHLSISLARDCWYFAIVAGSAAGVIASIADSKGFFFPPHSRLMTLIGTIGFELAPAREEKVAPGR